MSQQNQELQMTQQELNFAREWIKDCVWQDIDSADDVDDLTDLQVIRGIKKHFSGGIEEFKRLCQE